MPYPHVIHLRGPWEYQPLASWRRMASGGWEEDTTDLPPPGRLKLPSDWGATLGRDFRGRVRYTRHFNLPTGLEPREHVWLVVEGVDARARVQLNGQPLGEARGYALPACFEITQGLKDRNELTIDVELPPPDSGALRPGRESKPGGLIRDVRLEICTVVRPRSIYLYTLARESRPALRVVIDLPGEPAAQPLNVHVTAERREFYFGPVKPGVPLTIENDVPSLPAWTPGAAGSLGHLDVKLLLRGEAVWEAAFATAYRSISFQPPDTLRLREREVHWPLRGLNASSITELAHPLPNGEVAALAEILTDEEYGRLDALGQPLVQHVPVVWSDVVCPRLAHHPAIIAWTAPAAELGRLDDRTRAQCCGRPWLPQEVVFP